MGIELIYAKHSARHTVCVSHHLLHLHPHPHSPEDLGEDWSLWGGSVRTDWGFNWALKTATGHWDRWGDIGSRSRRGILFLQSAYFMTYEICHEIYISCTFFFNINLFILFIYFWLCWVFGAVCGLSLVEESRGYSLLWCADFSLQWLLLSQSTGSRHMGFSSCGARA